MNKNEKVFLMVTDTVFIKDGLVTLTKKPANYNNMEAFLNFGYWMVFVNGDTAHQVKPTALSDIEGLIYGDFNDERHDFEGCKVVVQYMAAFSVDEVNQNG